MTINAIPTSYAGHRFRSRLEARWAVFFDTLKVPWQYEPQGFRASGSSYLPDFRVTLEGVVRKAYVEVKGDPAAATDLKKIIPLCEAGNAIIIAGPIPRPGLHGPHFHLLTRSQLEGDPPQLWTASFFPLKGSWGIFPFGWPRLITSDNELVVKDLSERNGWVRIPGALELAYGTARSARFEHGESPTIPASSIPPLHGDWLIPRDAEDSEAHFFARSRQVSMCGRATWDPDLPTGDHQCADCRTELHRRTNS